MLKKNFQIILFSVWAYLWGIESYQKEGKALILRRFEPTYEELKGIHWHKGSDYFSQFEPTYEELKEFTPPPVSTCPLWFEPTYEELKDLLIVKIFCCFWVWAYLWGIERFIIFPANLLNSLFEPTYEELKVMKKKTCG